MLSLLLVHLLFAKESALRHGARVLTIYIENRFVSEHVRGLCSVEVFFKHLRKIHTFAFKVCCVMVLELKFSNVWFGCADGSGEIEKITEMCFENLQLAERFPCSSHDFSWIFLLFSEEQLSCVSILNLKSAWEPTTWRRLERAFGNIFMIMHEW